MQSFANMDKFTPIANRFSTLLFVTYLLAVSAFAYLRPYYNWDMLGYIALAFSVEDHNPESVHRRTYEVIQSSVPKETYLALTSPEHQYRNLMANDYRRFQEQLHLYSIRPLYVYFLFSLHKIGIEIVRATVLLSILSSVGLLLVIFVWTRKYFNGITATTVVMLLGTGTGVTQLARLSTPDALSSLMMLSAIFLLVETRSTVPAILLFCLSLLVRTDNLVLVLIVFTHLRFFSSMHRETFRTMYVPLIIATTGIVATIHLLHGYYVWNETSYSSTMLSGIKQLVVNDGYSVLTCFLLMGSACIVLTIRNRLRANLYSHLNVLMLVSILGRFLLFPQVADRLLAVQYIVIGIALMIVASPFVKNGTSEQKVAGIESE